ncbi:MAG: SDR family oxidoreductase [Leptospirales bacterium]
MTKILITGAGGYIGQELVARLSKKNASAQGDQYSIVALDVRETPVEKRLAGVSYETADIRDESLRRFILKERPAVVVHLASIVSAGGDAEFEYSVDITGTKNVLDSCVAAGVGQIIVTSSGAAYGYHADSPEWLKETHPLRGNESFAYSRHKRMVEEMLQEYKTRHPELRQLIFRPGSVIGENVSNQITALFEKPWVMGIAGSKSSFVFIWDEDVVRCFMKGIEEQKQGVYNLAGTGALTMREIARILKKPYIPIPPFILKAALWLARALSLTKLGPEHVKFLQFRPVLDNSLLINQFGYTPKKTTREAFELYLNARQK